MPPSGTAERMPTGGAVKLPGVGPGLRSDPDVMPGSELLEGAGLLFLR
jgi:hypothetical protein